MYFWKYSEKSSIFYYIVKTPEQMMYHSSAPVSTRGEVGAEILLGSVVQANNLAVFYSMWNQGILPLENQIVALFKQSNSFEKDLNEFNVKTAFNFDKSGVLIVATVKEATFTNPEVGVPQRVYQSAYIGGLNFDRETAIKFFESKPKLSPSSKAWKTVYYYIWATKQKL